MRREKEGENENKKEREIIRTQGTQNIPIGYGYFLLYHLIDICLIQSQKTKTKNTLKTENCECLECLRKSTLILVFPF